MGTMPSYSPATEPLGDTDQFYLEQGSGADRGKRATVQMVLNKASSALGASIAAQPTDSNGVVTGDFIAGENGGIGKKIPVSAFERAPFIFRMPFTGAKSFRMVGSIDDDSYADNLVGIADNAASAISIEGLGRLELYMVFKYDPTEIVSSSRRVALYVSDCTDNGTDMLAALLSIKMENCVWCTAVHSNNALHTYPKAITCRLQSTTASEIALELFNADGSDMTYADLYSASVTSAYITVQVRIIV